MDIHNLVEDHHTYGSTLDSDLYSIDENSRLLRQSESIPSSNHCPNHLKDNGQDTVKPSVPCIHNNKDKSVYRGLLKSNIIITLLVLASFLLGQLLTIAWIHIYANYPSRASIYSSQKRSQQIANAKLDYLNNRRYDIEQQNDWYYNRHSLLADILLPSRHTNDKNLRNQETQNTANKSNDSNIHDTPNLEDKSILSLSLSSAKKNDIADHDADSPLNGCEGTIIILRHCEKGSLKEHCAYIGYERAIYLSTLFGSSPDHRWPKPTYLYALSAGGRSNSNLRNWREVETLLPLSQRINVPIDDSYGVDQGSDLALHLLTDLVQPGHLCGKVALISWKHDDIPHLAHELGCGPLDGCPEFYPSTTFDDAWQIKFAYHYPFHDESTSLNNRMTESSETTDSSSTSHPINETAQWYVYGTVLQENFDPLAFSKKMGDYNEEENSKGRDKWMDLKGEDNIPENALGQSSTASNSSSSSLTSKKPLHL